MSILDISGTFALGNSDNDRPNIDAQTRNRDSRYSKTIYVMSLCIHKWTVERKSYVTYTNTCKMGELLQSFKPKGCIYQISPDLL